MSSEKELNRAKWQHSRRYKHSNQPKKHNQVQTYKQFSLTSETTQQPTQAPGLQQTFQQINSNTDPTHYLDNFDLDFEESAGNDEGVEFNSSGFDFEQLLKEAQNDSLANRRHWTLSQEFEDRQAFMEQSSEFMLVDLQMLGQALEELPLHQLFGIDASFFDKDTQQLTWNSEKQSIPIESDEILDELLQVDKSSKPSQRSHLNSNSYRIHRDGIIPIAEDEQINQQEQEQELDRLLFGEDDQICERNNNIINSQSIQNKVFKNNNSQKLQQFSNRNKDSQDDLEDELDQLLQL